MRRPVSSSSGAEVSKAKVHGPASCCNRTRKPLSLKRHQRSPMIHVNKRFVLLLAVTAGIVLVPPNADAQNPSADLPDAPSHSAGWSATENGSPSEKKKPGDPFRETSCAIKKPFGCFLLNWRKDITGCPHISYRRRDGGIDRR